MDNHDQDPIVKKRRYLTNSEQEIFTRLQQLNELSKEETQKVFVEICTLPDIKPEDWDLQRIRNIWLRQRRTNAKKE
jgi:hypothetical protein